MAKRITGMSVFVRSIEKRSASGVVVEAEQGSENYLVRFMLPVAEVEKCYIGKRYDVVVEDPDE